MHKTFTLYDDSIPNSDGSRLLLSGIDLSRFKKNPVMLYMHQRGEASHLSGSEVIGRWENIRITGNRLLAEAVFDQEDALAAKIAHKVQENFLRAASIGIEVLSMDDEETLKVKGQTGPTIIRSVLIEASIVDIPGNENAVINRCSMYQHYASWHDATTRHSRSTPLAGEDSMQALTQELEAVQAAYTAFRKDRAEEAISDAMACGALEEAERDLYLSLFKKNFKLTAKTLRKRTARWQKESVSRHVSSHLQGLGQHHRKEVPQDRETILSLKKNNPAGFQKYLNVLADKACFINKI